MLKLIYNIKKAFIENKFDYNSLNVYPGWGSVDKFIESDSPGTLSWLNMEASNLKNDSLLLIEVELGIVESPCISIKPDKQEHSAPMQET